MKNLFEFAGHELSQDAFLRYIIENFDDEAISPVARKLLERLCYLEKSEEIKPNGVWSKAQWNKIDIAFEITTTKRIIDIFVEDKTFSCEHDQLERYKQKVISANWQGKDNTYYVFYKSSKTKDWEKEKCKECDWDVLDIDEIAGLFSEFTTSKNLIVSMHAQYVQKLKDAYANVDIPETNNGKVDYVRWQSFFEALIAEYKNDGYDEKLVMWTGFAGRYPYTYLCFRARNKSFLNNDYNVPYLEVRSRDCTNGNFRALILTYGMEESVFHERFPKLYDAIKDNNIFKTKYIRKDFPKTIGQYKTQKDSILSKNEFVQTLKNLVDTYLELMKNW